MSEAPTFEDFNRAIEQRALGNKLAGMASRRQETVDWAVQDAIDKSIPVDEVGVITSPYASRPKYDQLRKASNLGVDPETGTIRNSLADSLFEKEPDDSTEHDFSRELSESEPAIGGLRRAVVEWRYKRTKEKIKELETRRKVAAHAGTIILRSRFGEGYFTHADDEGLIQAPVSKGDRRHIEKMEKLQNKRHGLNSRIRKLDALVEDSGGHKTRSRINKREGLVLRANELERRIKEQAYRSPKLDRKLARAASRRDRLQAKLLGEPYEATRTERFLRTTKEIGKKTTKKGRGQAGFVSRKEPPAAPRPEHTKHSTYPPRPSGQRKQSVDHAKIKPARTKRGERWRLQQEENRKGVI